VTRDMGNLFMRNPRNRSGSQATAQVGRLLRALPVVLLSACATPADRPLPQAPGTGVPAMAEQAAPAHAESVVVVPGEAGDQLVSPTGQVDDEPEAILHLGSGRFTDPTASLPRPLPPEGNREVTLNFDNASLEHVVETILGEILGETYLISPEVGGSASFSTSEPLTRRALLPVLEALLAVNDAALVHAGDFYRIVHRSRASGLVAPGGATPGDSPGYQVRVLQPRHLPAVEMVKLLEPFSRSETILSVDEARNLIIVGGSAGEIHNFAETVRIFDVSWLEGMSVGIFPVRAVDPAILVEELDSIFGAAAGAPLGNLIRLQAIERLASIMVIAVEPGYVERVGNWIRHLDRSNADRQEPRLFVYQVQNVKATDLAPILADLFSDEDDGDRRRGGYDEDPLISGLMPAWTGDDGFDPVAPSRAVSSGTPGESSVALVGGRPLRITAVEESNALLIRGTQAQYATLREALDLLDTVPLQVMIEARIVEVTLTDQLSFGVQWFVDSTRGERTSELTFGLPVPSVEGSSLSWNIVRNNVEGFLRALESITTLDVLSSPTLVVLNNREAEINVGDQVPVITTSIQPGSGQTDAIRSVEFRDTGVILSVTPRVNPGGLVYLDIAQEVSDPGEVEPVSGNRTILRRTVNTEVAVHSGETIVLGGLIRENRSSGRSGVPVLGRMPLIGPLFGQRSRDLRRTELIVMIRPTVIDNRDTAREVLREYRRGFREIAPLRAEF